MVEVQQILGKAYVDITSMGKELVSEGDMCCSLDESARNTTEFTYILKKTFFNDRKQIEINAQLFKLSMELIIR